MGYYLLFTTAAALCLFCYSTGDQTDYVDYMEIRPSIFSGRPDPVFGVLSTNPNFTSIVKTASNHTSRSLASILGYRGFEITLYNGANHTVPFYLPFTQTVNIGKCEDPTFEEKLLQTVSQLPDKQGTKMSTGLAQQVENSIKSCTASNIDSLQVTMSIYSGTRDPVFNLLKTNPNFTTIATTMGSRQSTPLNGILGYRGFSVRLQEHGQNGTRTVTLGKCSLPDLEDKLLQTVSQVPDTHGDKMPPSTVQYVSNEIRACTC